MLIVRISVKVVEMVLTLMKWRLSSKVLVGDGKIGRITQLTLLLHLHVLYPYHYFLFWSALLSGLPLILSANGFVFGELIICNQGTARNRDKAGKVNAQ